MKSNKLLIFGNGEIADLANFYFSKFSNYSIKGFVLDKKYINKDTFCKLPIINMAEIKNKYPVDEYSFFVALSYKNLNEDRKKKYLDIKKLGYKFASFISPQATVLNDNRIGENCFIFENNVIQPYVSIGNNITIWSGNHIGHHSIIKDHTFISSHVVISGGVEIDEQVFLGVNSTIRDHIKIGKKSVIGAGSLILKNVEENSVYYNDNSSKSKVTSDKLKKI